MPDAGTGHTGVNSRQEPGFTGLKDSLKSLGNWLD
jgi:hypothetical protein